MQIESVGAPAFLVSVTPGRDYLYVKANETFFRQTALPREWFRGMRVADVLQGSMRDLILREYDRCLETKSQVEFETSFDRDGQEVVFRTTITPILHRKRIVSLLGVTIDVTNERVAERELKVTNIQLAHALKALKGIAWRYDTNLNAFQTSPELRALLGDVDISDLSYSAWVELIHPDDRERYESAFERLCEGSAADDLMDFRVVIGAVTHRLRCHRTAVAESNGSQWVYGVVRDVTIEVETQENLETAASKDSLTGLLNHGAFVHRLQTLIERGRRVGQSVAVLMIDLDDFKPVNDTLGHAAGDMLLQTIGSRILEETRDTDICGRLGGDEFAVAVMGLSPSLVEAMSRSVRQRVSAPVSYHSHKISVGVSLGFSIDEAAEADALALIKAADDALYLDKGKKRDRS